MRAGAPHGGSSQQASPERPSHGAATEPRSHPIKGAAPPASPVQQYFPPPPLPPGDVFRHAATLTLPCSLCNGTLPARRGRIPPSRREKFTRIPNHGCKLWMCDEIGADCCRELHCDSHTRAGLGLRRLRRAAGARTPIAQVCASPVNTLFFFSKHI